MREDALETPERGPCWLDYMTSQRMTAAVQHASVAREGDIAATQKWEECEVMRMPAMMTRDSRDRVLGRERGVQRWGEEKMIVCG